MKTGMASERAMGLQVLHRIPGAIDSLFLTFDDGPDPLGTPLVLELLKKHNCLATFFLVAEKAKDQPELVKRILKDGHTIGNHSLDHRYGAFFSSQTSMQNWIKSSVEVFNKLGVSPVGFRPPAGVRTPKLHKCLNDLQIPLIMWEKRFFDTTFPFTPARALRSMTSTRPGAIILLHDRQRASRILSFLKTLEIYLLAAKGRGLQFRSLTGDLCKPKVNESTKSIF